MLTFKKDLNYSIGKTSFKAGESFASESEIFQRTAAGGRAMPPDYLAALIRAGVVEVSTPKATATAAPVSEKK